jgi:FixJ family two-component response regulator
VLASELRRQGVRVDAQLVPGCRVMADRVQIEQVVLNLILNAAKAMQAHAPDERALRVSVAPQGESDIVVAVQDSGPGIDPAHLDSVFEPFWTTGGEGIGLGLAICRSIVEAHGGRIHVERNADRGATFRFALRRHIEARTAPAAVEVDRAGPAARPRASSAVCVVDDDANVRESLARLIAAAGWDVSSFASAREFLERGAGSDPACVVLDVRMPGMSGLELYERLREGGEAPPAVFVTGEGDVAMSVDAMKLGAVDFLEKPVDGDVLVAAVRRALARHAAAREHALERERCCERVERLSTREREIAAHVIRGRLNKQIAADLGIAEQTVKQHRGRMMEKLEVGSVPDLVRVCEASGLFPPESVLHSDTGPGLDRHGPRAGTDIPPR